ncbi:MAG: hypothetical protein GXP62_17200 [Oligoflexia bacterium]|nr:hypothetical protein [Oligoflexia bacterium]
MASVLFLALPLIVGCGGKKPAPAAAGDSKPSASAKKTGTYPTDATSQGFLSALTSMTVHNFLAVDNGGATVVLSTLNFTADNEWSASGYVDAGDERMECTEHGTWTMEAATSNSSATISWVIGTTDCAGREPGTSTRAKIDIVGDDIEVAFR